MSVAGMETCMRSDGHGILQMIKPHNTASPSTIMGAIHLVCFESVRRSRKVDMERFIACFSAVIKTLSK